MVGAEGGRGQRRDLGGPWEDMGLHPKYERGREVRLQVS